MKAPKELSATQIAYGSVASAALVGIYALFLQVGRLSIGLNTLDEAYYALFLHQFDEVGISRSFDRTIHQVSALFVFPFVKAFWSISRSHDGTIIFLRVLYVLWTVLGAAVLALLLKSKSARVDDQWSSAILGSIVYLGFVPFGVQALSYNTIPIFFSILLLASICIIRLENWSWVIAGIFASCCIASSPQTAPIVAGLLIMKSVRDWRLGSRNSFRFLLLFVGFLIVGVVLAYSFGYQKIGEIIEFQRSYSSIEGLRYRLLPAVRLLKDDTALTGLLLLTVLQRGFFAARFATISKVLVFAGVIALLIKETHLIFIPHEIVFLLGSASLWRIFSRVSWTRDFNRSVVVTTSLGFACLFGIATGNNPIYNFSAGLVLAAGVTVADLAEGRKPQWSKLGQVLGALCVIVLCVQSQTLIAAADDQAGYVYQVESGWFAGIKTTPKYKELMKNFNAEITSNLDKGRSLAYFGDHFGLLLDMSFDNYAPQSYPLVRGNRLQNPPPVSAIRAGTDFYQLEEHRPITVVVENGQLNPIGYQFLCYYSFQYEASLSEDVLIRVFRLDSDKPACPS